MSKVYTPVGRVLLPSPLGPHYDRDMYGQEGDTPISSDYKAKVRIHRRVAPRG